MVRTVVGDENQLDAQVDSIFRTGCSVQVGLLIGKLGNSGSRDLVFALVPTPRRDGEDAATLGSSDIHGHSQGRLRMTSKGKRGAESAPMHVITDWVGEHARQVSRMLVGGMHVVGAYAFSSEGTFKSSLAILWQAVSAVAASVRPSLDGGEAPEYLLLHIASSPRWLSCRSCSKGANFSTGALHPCEWKVGKLLNNLQEFSCTYTVDIRHLVQPDAFGGASNDPREHLSSAIAHEAARLQAAYAVVDGFLVQPERLLGSGATAHTVELLLPVGGGAQFTQLGAKTAGKLVCMGQVHARAYGVSREPVSRVITELKADIVASLRARIEVLIDEAEAVEDAKLDNQNGQKDSIQESALLIRHLSADVFEYGFVMPRRVFVPWIGGAMFCDYMLPNETLKDVEDRARDLFSVEQKLDPSSIMEPEILGTIPEKTIVKPELKDATQHVTENTRVAEAKTAVSGLAIPFIFTGAALVLLLALLFSVIFISR